MNRACGFGLNFDDYFHSANDEITMIAQIETGLAIDTVREIASVDGVDVLFIGPLDLSVSLGIAKQFDHPDMRRARAKVVDACGEFGKAAGILLSSESQIDETIAEGFSFVGMGSDGAAAASGLAKIADTLKKSKPGSAGP
jgi:4-hydroxy-2-oxoheptanedioate aldolase